MPRLTRYIGSRKSLSASPEPADIFSLQKEAKEKEVQAETQESQTEDNAQVSAADYDPSLDRREDEERRVRAITTKQENHAEDEVMEVEEEVEEEDDVDDMFAVDPVPKKKKTKIRVVVSLSSFSYILSSSSFVQKPAPAYIANISDSAADAEGYYQIILGEQLDGGKYQVFSSLGKGMFSNVVRARVLQGDAGEAGHEVAIKIVRAQETMYAAILDA